MSAQRVDEVVELALHYEIELVDGQGDPMVSDAILLEVVGSDLLRPIAAADHRLPLTRLSLMLLLLFDFLKTRPQNAHRRLAVFYLRLFVLHGNDDASRQMCYSNSRVSGVH